VPLLAKIVDAEFEQPGSNGARSAEGTPSSRRAAGGRTTTASRRTSTRPGQGRSEGGAEDTPPSPTQSASNSSGGLTPVANPMFASPYLMSHPAMYAQPFYPQFATYVPPSPHSAASSFGYVSTGAPGSPLNPSMYPMVPMVQNPAYLQQYHPASYMMVPSAFAMSSVHPTELSPMQQLARYQQQQWDAAAMSSFYTQQHRQQMLMPYSMAAPTVVFSSPPTTPQHVPTH